MFGCVKIYHFFYVFVRSSIQLLLAGLTFSISKKHNKSTNQSTNQQGLAWNLAGDSVDSPGAEAAYPGYGSPDYAAYMQQMSAAAGEVSGVLLG